MVLCCVPFCKSRSDKGKQLDENGLKVSFHGFPLNPEMRMKWILAIRRRGENSRIWLPSRYSTVCSKHFSSHDFYVKGEKELNRLWSEAVPSIFPGYPSRLLPSSSKVIERNTATSKKSKVSSRSIPNGQKEGNESSSVQATVGQELHMLPQEHGENWKRDIQNVIAENLVHYKRQKVQFPKYVRTVGVNTVSKFPKLQLLRDKVRSLQRTCNNLQNKLLRSEARQKYLVEKNSNLEGKLEEYNITELESAAPSNRKADFLLEQLRVFGRRSPQLNDKMMQYCLLLQKEFPNEYHLLKEKNLLSLPSKSTLHRYRDRKGGVEPVNEKSQDAIVSNSESDEPFADEVDDSTVLITLITTENIMEWAE